MTTRLERLLLLLDSGSTQATRKAAAQQIGDVLKYHPHELWSLLSKVQVFLRSKTWDTREAAGFAVDAIARNVPFWDPDKAAEALRQADSAADPESRGTELEGSSSALQSADVAAMDTSSDERAALLSSATEEFRLSFEKFDLERVLSLGKPLLASVGTEFDVDWGDMDLRERLALQRQRLQQRLGLFPNSKVDIASGAEEFVKDEDLVIDQSFRVKRRFEEVDENATTSVSELVGPTLSARQKNRLKRQKSAVRTGSRSTSADIAAAVASTNSNSNNGSNNGSSSNGSSGASPSAKRASTKTVMTEQGASENKIVVESISDSHLTLALADEWPFQLFCEELLNFLFDPSWEVRHGAGVGLREVLKTHGAQAGMSAKATAEQNRRLNAEWLEDVLVRLLCVFALDRFGDFVSDQVVAPVRETCAQTLGAVLQFVQPSIVAKVLDSLLCLCKRPQWETRHSGLLGVKYIIAVRRDLSETLLPKLLPPVLAGLQDDDDDVRSVAANALLPICDLVVKYSEATDGGQTTATICAILWDTLLELDDLSASTASVLNLLAELLSFPFICERMALFSPDQSKVAFSASLSNGRRRLPLHVLVPRLYNFIHHGIAAVRSSSLTALGKLLDMTTSLFKARFVFQGSVLVRGEKEARSSSSRLSDDSDFSEDDDDDDDDDLTEDAALDKGPLNLIELSTQQPCSLNRSVAWWVFRHHEKLLRHLFQHMLLESEEALLQASLGIWVGLVEFVLPQIALSPPSQSSPAAAPRLLDHIPRWLDMLGTLQGVPLSAKDLILPLSKTAAHQQQQQQHSVTPAAVQPTAPASKRARQSKSVTTTAAAAAAPTTPKSTVTHHYTLAGAQDYSLADSPSVSRCRIVGCKAIAALGSVLPPGAASPFESLLLAQLSSLQAMRRVVASTVLAEWLGPISVWSSTNKASPAADGLLRHSPAFHPPTLVSSFQTQLVNLLSPQAATPVYFELSRFVETMRGDCRALIQAFSERGLPPESVASAGDCMLYNMEHALELATSFFASWAAYLDHVEAESLRQLQASIDKTTTLPKTPSTGRQLQQLVSQLRSRQEQIAQQAATCATRKTAVQSAVQQLETAFEKLNVLTTASLALALVSVDAQPEKLNPIVKPLMDSIKSEERAAWQWRSAHGIVRLLQLCVARSPSPNEKIVRNICSFACGDPKWTPTLPSAEDKPDWPSLVHGILTLQQQRQLDAEAAQQQQQQQSRSRAAKGGSLAAEIGGDDETVAATVAAMDTDTGSAPTGGLLPRETPVSAVNVKLEAEKLVAAQVAREGGELTLKAACHVLCDGLFESLPKLWSLVAEPLESIFGTLPPPAESLGAVFQSAASPESGSFSTKWTAAWTSKATQDVELARSVVTALQLLEGVVGAAADVARAAVKQRLLSLLPRVFQCLSYPCRAVRHLAARVTAAYCKHFRVPAVESVVFFVLPMLHDTDSAERRQGAAEALYHTVERLSMDVVPFIVFLILPLLGSMSDFDEDVRQTCTSSFASLLRLLPLESGTPSPSDMSPVLVLKRNRDRRFLEQLLDSSKLDNYSVPVPIRAELRKYQQEGVNWLHFLNRYRLHGILCDDMGLGKTLQSICILASDHHERKLALQKHQQQGTATSGATSVKSEQGEQPGSTTNGNLPSSGSEDHSAALPFFETEVTALLPSLVVCPSTLVGHWYHEILKFADASVLRPLMYFGAKQERTALQGQCLRVDVVISSYEIVRNDIDFFQAQHFNYIILDEGHIIKNAKAKITTAIKCIPSNHRLILSGTPIQNNVLELWSLFDFLMPGFLGTEKRFAEAYSKPILASRGAKSSSREQEAGTLALENLHRQVLPFILRRMKEDVLQDLPPKIIQDYYCELSDLQLKLYESFARSQSGEAVMRQIAGAGDEASGSSSVSELMEEGEAEEGTAAAKGKAQHVFQALQFLRKLCNHPCLVLRPKHPLYASLTADLKREGSSVADIKHAPKLLALRQLLVDCGIGGAPSSSSSSSSSSSDAVLESDMPSIVGQHRALVFCQMKEMLDVIETELLAKLMPSATYLRLDGSINALERFAIVTKFNDDPSIDLLLLTTHVGGLGLNLTGADTVIFVDHDWNPSRDLQAMDRAHRIGQKKVVNVYRLITRGTLEEKIMSLQQFKLNIANTVITQENSSLRSMDTSQLLDLFSVPAVKGGGASATESERAAAGAEAKSGAKAVLDSLGELWDDTQYENEYNVDSFLSSLEGSKGDRKGKRRAK